MTFTSGNITIVIAASTLIFALTGAFDAWQSIKKGQSNLIGRDSKTGTILAEGTLFGFVGVGASLGAVYAIDGLIKANTSSIIAGCTRTLIFATVGAVIGFAIGSGVLKIENQVTKVLRRRQLG